MICGESSFYRVTTRHERTMSPAPRSAKAVLESQMRSVYINRVDPPGLIE